MRALGYGRAYFFPNSSSLASPHSIMASGMGSGRPPHIRGGRFFTPMRCAIILRSSRYSGGRLLRNGVGNRVDAMY